jgi:hypothetical protein
MAKTTKNILSHLEYDYKSDKIFKVIQDPIKGKLLRMDTFIPFAWVGDLTK